MATDNLKDFTMQFTVGGLLLTCLIGFVISFMYQNNPLGLSDGADDVFNDAYGENSQLILASGDEADSVLNITANTNPEISDSGSRDTVATAYKSRGNAVEYWNSAKKILGWVFSGTIGKMLLVAIGGMIGILSYFYIMQHIRQGR